MKGVEKMLRETRSRMRVDSKTGEGKKRKLVE